MSNPNPLTIPVGPNNCFVPELVGRSIDITPENAQEYAALIGQPLADAIAESGKKPVKPNQYVQLIPVLPRNARVPTPEERQTLADARTVFQKPEAAADDPR